MIGTGIVFHHFITRWRKKTKDDTIAGVLQLYIFQQWPALFKFAKACAMHPDNLGAGSWQLTVDSREQVFTTGKP